MTTQNQERKQQNIISPISNTTEMSEDRQSSSVCCIFPQFDRWHTIALTTHHTMNYWGDAFTLDSYSNPIPDGMTSNSLSPQISEKDLIHNVAPIIIEPFPLHPKPFDCCLKLEDDLEPTPIHPKGISYSFSTKLQCLPDMITKYCDDYISLLRGDLDDKTLRPSEINQGACVSSDESTGTTSYPAFQNERWMDRFHELVDFYKKEGHYSVPYKRNTTLFQWVKRQRHQYKLRNMGEHSNLTQERINILTKIGFVY
jgi:hypothetical protein